MDYKEKYKEALEKARTFSQRWQGIEATDSELALRELKEIFPELKESEDERIRKEIIRIVDIWTNSCPTVNGIPAETLLAWLEKQGEQKPTNKKNPKFKVGDIITPKDGGHEPWQILQVDILDKKYRFKDGYVIHFSQEDNYKLVKQKTDDKVEPKFKVGDVIKNIDNGDTVKIEQILDNYYYYSGWDGAATIHSDFMISEQDNWELVEQKPAWSEEDEEVFHCLEYTVKHYYDDKDTINKCCSWLKSLKQRMKGE